MNLPVIKIEKEVMKSGWEFAFGVDEAGRGPLAGPVVAGAAWVRPDFLEQDFELKKLIRDSKTLSAKQREEVFEFIMESENFEIGIGEISHTMIDKLNILNASLLAMRLAVEDLLEKAMYQEGCKETGASNEDRIKNIPNSVCLLIDGNRKIPKIKYEQRLFVKGDARVFSIAAASICAKVHRDKIMQKYHEKYPHYGFDTNKGYGTRRHFECLEKNGPCEIHRKSFGPLKIKKIY